MNQYVILSNTGSLAGGLKLMFVPSSYNDDKEPPRERKTLSGKTNLSFAPPAFRCSFTAHVQHTLSSQYSGYITSDQLKAMFAGTTMASRKLIFSDPFGAIKNVVMTKCASEPALKGVLDGASGWHTFHIELKERSAA